MFVHSYVGTSCSWNLQQSFPQSWVKVSQVGYISWTTHQKAFIIRLWVPWKVCFHATSFGPRVHAPGWGWRSKARTPLKSVFLLFSLPVWSTGKAIVVTPVVRIRIRVSITLQQSFICNFFTSSYLDSHPSESIHIWTIGALEGWLPFHGSWSQDTFLGVGLEIKI